jgi:hypothetical protein
MKITDHLPVEDIHFLIGAKTGWHIRQAQKRTGSDPLDIAARVDAIEGMASSLDIIIQRIAPEASWGFRAFVCRCRDAAWRGEPAVYDEFLLACGLKLTGETIERI